MTSPPFRLLTRHFVGTMLQPEILSETGADSLRRLLFGLLAMLLVLGVFLPRVFFEKYAGLAALADLAPYTRALQADTLFMIAVPMFIIATATVIAGPLLFPDETDYRVLTPLPISRGQLFGAKLAAVAALVMAAVVATNLLATSWFPLVVGLGRAEHGLWRRIGAHTVASVAASLFAATSVIAVQGLLLTLLRPAWRRPLAPFAQGGLLVTLLLSLPILGRMSGFVVTQATVREVPLAMMPPVWFLGIERWLLDGPAAGGYTTAARVGAGAFVAAIALVVATYLALYRSAEQLADLGGAQRRSGQARGVVDRVVGRLPLPPQTLAVIDFVLRGLLRSRLHQFVLVLTVGVGVAALIAEFAAVAAGSSPLVRRPGAGVQAVVAAPLLVALTVGLGLRATFRWPLDRGAAWLFRMTEHAGTRTAVLDGTSACLTAATCTAAVLTAAIVQPSVLGAPWWSAAVLTVLEVMVLVEYLLVGWNRVPYTCSYLPGKRAFAIDIAVFAGRYVVVVLIGGNVIRWSMLDPARTLACAGVLLTSWAALRRWRWRQWGFASLEFEDDDPTEVERLSLRA